MPAHLPLKYEMHSGRQEESIENLVPLRIAEATIPETHTPFVILSEAKNPYKVEVGLGMLEAVAS